MQSQTFIALFVLAFAAMSAAVPVATPLGGNRESSLVILRQGF